MENAKEIVIDKNKINYKEFLKISVNKEHQCVAALMFQLKNLKNRKIMSFMLM